ncbi:hypothetical protein DDF62_23315 [Caulobacter radicis]|jgi:hypothetical protein|uniref:hypothetical protein n=1 Tax=Caulobacter radicis TaxID=2172650 RepID=UPI000D5889BD|nr:hypothetical protein [Caulobacter radicis]PVM83937.1 hypothetical protein DDF62_23315 [Caulobacter radicis]
MRFAVLMVLTYATALASAAFHLAATHGPSPRDIWSEGDPLFLALSHAARLAWLLSMTATAFMLKGRALWAAPSALPALLPWAGFAALVLACSTGSSGCF